MTITTYQMLTWRRDKTGGFEHFDIFSSENWGLVVYDEVHLLPAPIFRVTADLQARRRLGLTATLVREDGKEDDVFCLIGPKRFDVPWKVLESQGFIAEARCVEVRAGMDDNLRTVYHGSGARAKFRVSSENPAKVEVVERILKRHPEGRILIIGQYIEQLEFLSQTLQAPLITGKTPNAEREVLYERFKSAGPPPDRQQGRELRHRPPRRQHRHPGLGHLRFPPGGAAPRSHPAPQVGRIRGGLLLGGDRGDAGQGSR